MRLYGLLALGMVLSLGVARLTCAQDIAPVVHVDNPPSLLAQQAKHYVVLVSLDGFRYDYGREYGTPNLDAMAREGVSTPDGMLPSYPSVTFPNHYTLVTGLRPEHTGIVGMEFYDPDRHDDYRYNDPAKSGEGTWYYGTPIWDLAEQQGMRSACFFWPGSEAAIDGIRPSFYVHYDDKLDDNKRIDQVVAWLQLPPAERPHLITLYYANTDHAGHMYGPDSPETGEAVHHVDQLIGTLRQKLKATGLPIDLIVTSDHGMVKVQGEPVVLGEIADLGKFRTEGSLLYAPTEADAEKLYEQLLRHPDPRFKVYRRMDVPPSLFYDASDREGDPVVVPTGPYAILAHAPTHKLNIGSHGFDANTMSEMKAIFYAEGPDIRPGVKLKSFDNVDVFPFLTHLLRLVTPPVDGSIVPLAGALR